MTADQVLTERAAANHAAETRPRRDVKLRRLSLSERSIAKVYKELAPMSGDFASLASLRDRLGGTRAEQDAMLTELDRQGRIRLFEEADRASLTPGDREAALQIDGKARHLLLLRED
jgi:hypothetical protein